MIVGAGNKFVAEAKRQLFGVVGIDLLAGPSEVLIIADESADPAIIAADMLAQAEHDTAARAVLVSLSEKTGKEAMEEIERQLRLLHTKDVAEISYRENGEIILVDSPEEAVRAANEWAPEHLEVQAIDSKFYFENCKNYGSLFLGEETTVAYGDKTIGTNHVLPTERAARYTGGLSVGTFLKTVTYQYVNKKASVDIAEVCERACSYENMYGHGASCRVRIEKYTSKM
jgi:sulfopropanediol 3-dehydrogenase